LSRPEIKRQITPLDNSDCLMVFDWIKEKFDYPIHFHPEYELTFIRNGSGVRRICGDHIGVIGDKELLLVGPNCYHCWEQGDCSGEQIHETIILFSRDMFQPLLLNKELMKPIRKLLIDAQRGVLFNNEVIELVGERIIAMTRKSGFDLIPALFDLLNMLAISPGKTILSSALPGSESEILIDDKLTKVYQFISVNYQRKVLLNELADEFSMTKITFNRFVKKRTNQTFTYLLNQFRVNQAVIQLIDSNKSISKIALECGFFNLSNFNRIFKQYKNCTPTDFRENYFKGR
jgi:AraC-like DNA-binding protein